MRMSTVFTAAMLAMTSAATVPCVAMAQAPSLTARDVLERIKANIGVPWSAQTVDTFKDGDPAAPVTGVAVTMMATLDVLQRAAAAGKNLVITHEPTFFGHLDDTSALEQEHDAVYAAKQAFIREHHLVVWRFHDYWHRRRPDGILTGVVSALGWQKFQNADTPFLFTVPATSLQALAGELGSKLHASIVRIVGDQQLHVTTVALAPGAAGFARHRGVLQRDD